MLGHVPDPTNTLKAQMEDTKQQHVCLCGKWLTLSTTRGLADWRISPVPNCGNIPLSRVQEPEKRMARNFPATCEVEEYCGLDVGHK